MLKCEPDHITFLLRTFRDFLLLSVSNLIWLPWLSKPLASWSCLQRNLISISQLLNDLFSFALFYFPWLPSFPICTSFLNLEDGSFRKFCLIHKSNLDTRPIYLDSVLLLEVLSLCTAIVGIFSLEFKLKVQRLYAFLPSPMYSVCPLSSLKGNGTQCLWNN